MALAEYTSIEFNSLINIVTPLERYSGSIFTSANNLLSFPKEVGFVNSNAIVTLSEIIKNENSLAQVLDKNYIRFLNKIEREYNYFNSEIPLHIVKQKFGNIYSILQSFNFENIFVEFTFDNALLFSIKNYDDKFIIQYFLEYDHYSDDDVEIIFSDLSSINKFQELKFENLKSFLQNKIQFSFI